MITEDNCSHCRADLRKGQYTRRIAIYDRDLDLSLAPPPSVARTAGLRRRVG